MIPQFQEAERWGIRPPFIPIWPYDSPEFFDWLLNIDEGKILIRSLNAMQQFLNNVPAATKVLSEAQRAALLARHQKSSATHRERLRPGNLRASLHEDGRWSNSYSLPQGIIEMVKRKSSQKKASMSLTSCRTCPDILLTWRQSKHRCIGWEEMAGVTNAFVDRVVVWCPNDLLLDPRVGPHLDPASFTEHGLGHAPASQYIPTNLTAPSLSDDQLAVFNRCIVVWDTTLDQFPRDYVVAQALYCYVRCSHTRSLHDESWVDLSADGYRLEGRDRLPEAIMELPALLISSAGPPVPQPRSLTVWTKECNICDFMGLAVQVRDDTKRICLQHKSGVDRSLPEWLPCRIRIHLFLLLW